MTTINGLAMGPLLILTLIVSGLIMVLRRVRGGGRRRGGIVAAVIFMLGLAMFGVLLPRTAYSRARLEQARAQAAREQARQIEKLRRQAMGRAESHGVPPGLAEKPDPDDADESSDDARNDADDSSVAELQDKVDDAVNELEEKVESTTDVVIDSNTVHVQTSHPPTPPHPPKVTTIGIRSSLPDRSTRAQIVTGILLAGVVLAGYFFLNANTRGHYTWRLRIGSTLVFIASLVIILLVTNCI